MTLYTVKTVQTTCMCNYTHEAYKRKKEYKAQLNSLTEIKLSYHLNMNLRTNFFFFFFKELHPCKYTQSPVVIFPLMAFTRLPGKESFGII